MNDNERTRFWVGTEFNAMVEVRLPDGRFFQQALTPGRCILGRSKHADVFLDDKSVSRTHASLEIKPDSITLKDLDSHNGIVVDGRSVKTCDLQPGDEFILGLTRLRLSFDECPTENAASSLAVPENQDFTNIGVGRHEADMHIAGPRASGLGGPSLDDDEGPIWQPPQSSSDASRKRARIVLLILTPLVILGLVVPSVMKNMELGPWSKAAPVTATRVAVDSERPPKPTDPNQALDSMDNGTRRLFEQAMSNYESGRLLDAIAIWREVLQRYPDQTTAKRRLERAMAERDVMARKSLERGERNYQYLKYAEAIRDWRYVLNLVPDPDHELHQKAASYLKMVAAKGYN